MDAVSDRQETQGKLEIGVIEIGIRTCTRLLKYWAARPQPTRYQMHGHLFWTPGVGAERGYWLATMQEICA
jgi:hypothetical protein